MKKQNADVHVINHGSVVSLRPVSKTGSEWIEANVSAKPWSWLGGSLVVDHRMVGDIIDGMVNDGLVLR